MNNDTFPYINPSLSFPGVAWYSALRDCLFFGRTAAESSAGLPLRRINNQHNSQMNAQRSVSVEEKKAARLKLKEREEQVYRQLLQDVESLLCTKGGPTLESRR
jgi:hypothetical protein